MNIVVITSKHEYEYKKQVSITKTNQDCLVDNRRRNFSSDLYVKTEILKLQQAVCTTGPVSLRGQNFFHRRTRKIF